jgi:uncharacterized membrane protein YbaN (DUF454 family)
MTIDSKNSNPAGSPRAGKAASRRSPLLTRLILLILGTLNLGLAVLGIFLPLLPTTPFLLAAVFCYARSSARLHAWVISRPFIAGRLEELTVRHGLTAKSKRTILAAAFAMMAGAAVLINKPVMYLVLGVIFGLKALYFWLGIRTIPAADGEAVDD